MKLDVVKLTSDLVAYRSESQLSNVDVTRHVAGILAELGFQIEEIPYLDANKVDKLSIVAKLGQGRGGLAFMSHDDVVPANPKDGWSSNPYKARIKNGRVFGRGACDMKGPLAASICAAARFDDTELAEPLYIVVTADEEVKARGAHEVVRRSKLFREASRGYGIICEPTRLRVVHAHKGSLSITITAHGRAAHTSTLKGVNANIKMIPFLNDMKEIYDEVLSAEEFANGEFRPSHSEWSIGINDHNPATNISPVRSVCTINYRPMPGIDVQALIKRTRASARSHGLDFDIQHVGDPLYTPVDAPLVKTALKLAGRRRATTVPYGTDGMAYTQKMQQMVVLGPGDIAQAHTVDEWIEVDQLRKGVELYARFIDYVCVQGLP